MSPKKSNVQRTTYNAARCVVLFCVLLVFSCQKKKIEPAIETAEKPPQILIIGEIPNPYKLSYAQTAFENLKSSNSRITMPTTIRTTSKYVVFKPATIAQADSLLLKTDLELFPYPLHLGIEGDLEEYREPSLTDEQPDWLYTVVRADFQFPADVPYQVLEDLYIPYDDENIANAQREVLPQFMEWLDEFERNAEIAAGVPAEEAQRRGRWTPKGNIQVFDNTIINPQNPNLIVNRAIPCHGAKVRIRNGVLFFHTLTDMSGNFNFGISVRNKVNYGIVWEREDYIIKDMSSIRRITRFPAFLKGPKIRGEWHTTITDRKHSYFATIHRAACDYYYHTPFGLETPPKRHWWFGKGSILAYLRQQNSNDFTGDFYSVGPHDLGFYIRIFNADRQKIEIYATTIHEYAHASHFRLRSNGNTYAFNSVHLFVSLTNCELRETWATAVEWAITSYKYRFFLGGNQPFSYRDGLFLRSRNDDAMRDGYTPLMIDLIDDVNQFSTAFPDARPFDEVQGFTIKDCENSIRGNIRNFGDFQSRINNLPVSQPQLPQIATLFEFYNSIQYTCGGSNQPPNTIGGE